MLLCVYSLRAVLCVGEALRRADPSVYRIKKNKESRQGPTKEL
jgi:hypothetical protein